LVAAAPVPILIDGIEQSPEMRQAKLPDRYRNLDGAELPPVCRH